MKTIALALVLFAWADGSCPTDQEIRTVATKIRQLIEQGGSETTWIDELRRVCGTDEECRQAVLKLVRDGQTAYPPTSPQ